MNNITPIIGISVGDINGVGLEVLVKTFQDQRMYNLCTPVLYANNMYFIKYIEKMNLVKIKFHSIKTISNIKKGCLNIINVWDEKININYGIFEKTYSKYSISSLKEVLKDATNKNIDGIVTLPINKNVFEKKSSGTFKKLNNFLSLKKNSFTKIEDGLAKTINHSRGV